MTMISTDNYLDSLGTHNTERILNSQQEINEIVLSHYMRKADFMKTRREELNPDMEELLKNDEPAAHSAYSEIEKGFEELNDDVRKSIDIIVNQLKSNDYRIITIPLLRTENGVKICHPDDISSKYDGSLLHLVHRDYVEEWLKSKKNDIKNQMWI